MPNPDLAFPPELLQGFDLSGLEDLPSDYVGTAEKLGIQGKRPLRQADFNPGQIGSVEKNIGRMVGGTVALPLAGVAAPFVAEKAGQLAEKVFGGVRLDRQDEETQQAIQQQKWPVIGAPGEALHHGLTELQNIQNRAVDVVTGGKSADETNRLMNVVGSTEANDIGSRLTRGAVQSMGTAFVGGRVGGTAGAILLPGIQRANQAYTEAIDAGHTGPAATAYALAQGGNEAGLTWLVGKVTNKLFGGRAQGLESIMGGEAGPAAVKATYKEIFKEVGREIGKEYPEELAILFVDKAMERAALRKEGSYLPTAQDVVDTMLQVPLQGGIGHIPSVYQDARETAGIQAEAKRTGRTPQDIAEAENLVRATRDAMPQGRQDRQSEIHKEANPDPTGQSSPAEATPTPEVAPGSPQADPTAPPQVKPASGGLGALQAIVGRQGSGLDHMSESAMAVQELLDSGAQFPPNVHAAAVEFAESGSDRTKKILDDALAGSPTPQVEPAKPAADSTLPSEIDDAEEQAAIARFAAADDESRAREKFEAQSVGPHSYSGRSGDADLEGVAEPADGMKRLYHGGSEPQPGEPRWTTPDLDYAIGYANKSGSKVYYTDVPQSELGNETDVNGIVGNHERPGAWKLYATPKSNPEPSRFIQGATTASGPPSEPQSVADIVGNSQTISEEEDAEEAEAIRRFSEADDMSIPSRDDLSASASPVADIVKPKPSETLTVAPQPAPGPTEGFRPILKDSVERALGGNKLRRKVIGTNLRKVLATKGKLDFEDVADLANEQSSLGFALGDSIRAGDYQGIIDAIDPPSAAIVAHHGTSREFSEFDPEKSGENIDAGYFGRGTYFTSDPALGQHYARSGQGRGPTAKRVLHTASLSLNNPYDFGLRDKHSGTRGEAFGFGGQEGKGIPTADGLRDAVYLRAGIEPIGPNEEYDPVAESKLSTALRDELLARGYDGAVATHPNGSTEYVVFKKGAATISKTEPVPLGPAANPTPPPLPTKMTRQEFLSRMKQHRGDEESEQITALMDAYAQTWSDRKGISEDEIYARMWNDVVSEEYDTPKGPLFYQSKMGQHSPQGAPRGRISFHRDGRATLRFFQGADASTAPHELGHIFRKHLKYFAPELLQQAEEALGVVNGDWSKVEKRKRADGSEYDYYVHEEAFARGFENYLATGETTNPALKPVFAKFKEWLVNLWNGFKGTPLEDNVNPNLKRVFDRMLAGKTVAKPVKPKPALAEGMYPFEQVGLEKPVAAEVDAANAAPGVQQPKRPGRKPKPFEGNPSQWGMWLELEDSETGHRKLLQKIAREDGSMDQQTTDDFVDQVLQKAARAADSFTVPEGKARKAALKDWVKTIAKRLLIDRNRGKQSSVQASSIDAENDEGRSMAGNVKESTTQAPMPDYERDEVRAIVGSVELNDNEETLKNLRMENPQASYAEMGRAMGYEDNPAVHGKRVWDTLVSKLRPKLAEQGYFQPAMEPAAEPESILPSDPEQRRRIGKAHGRQPKSWAEWAKDQWEKFRQVTRPNSHLARTGDNATANRKIRDLAFIPEAMADQTQREIAQIIEPLMTVDPGDAKLLLAENPEIERQARKQFRGGTPDPRFMLFQLKIIYDNMMSEIKKGRSARLGFTKEDLQKELDKIDRLLKGQKQVRKALMIRKAMLSNKLDEAIDLGLAPEEWRGDLSYYHQDVLDYQAAMSHGSQTPRMEKKSYRKARSERDLSGEEFDYNTNYLEAENQWLQDFNEDLAIARWWKEVEGHLHVDKNPVTQQTHRGYTVDPSSPAFLAVGVTEKTMQYKLAQLAADHNKTVADVDTPAARQLIEEMIAMQRPQRQLFLPNAMVDQLESMKKVAPEGWRKQWMGLHGKWKTSILYGPHRFLSYFFGNIPGDLGPVLGGAPLALAESPMALVDVFKHFNIPDTVATPLLTLILGPKYAKQLGPRLNAKLTGGKKLHEITDEMRGWRDEGLFGSSFNQSDMPTMKDVTMLEALQANPSLLLSAWHQYWPLVRKLDAAREAILRLSVARYYHKALTSDRKIKLSHYGASSKTEIDRLAKELGPRAAAAKMAADLLGDYGALPAWAKAVRDVVPFFAWSYINLTRYPYMAANAAMMGWRATEGQHPIVRGAATVPTGILAGAMIGSVEILASLWNHLRYPEEEKKLSAKQKAESHIIWGTNPDGTVRTKRNFGALGEALSWFGVGTILSRIDELRHGQMSPAEVAREAGREILSQKANSISPFLKTPVEVVQGRSFFPDVFNTQPMDRGDILAGSVGLKDTKRGMQGWLFKDGSRMRPDWFGRLLGTVVDPNKEALYATIDHRDRYLDKLGKDKFAGNQYMRSMREAASNDDMEAFVEARNWYVKNGGDFNNFLRSTKRTGDPLDGLDTKEREDFEKNYLSYEQRQKLEVAKGYGLNLRTAMWQMWHAAGKSENDEVADALRDQVTSHATSLAKTVLRERPTGLTPKEKSDGLTLEAKRTEWQKDKDAAKDELKQAGMEPEDILAAYRKKMVEEGAKDFELLNGKVGKLRREMDWKKPLKPVQGSPSLLPSREFKQGQTDLRTIRKQIQAGIATLEAHRSPEDAPDHEEWQRSRLAKESVSYALTDAVELRGQLQRVGAYRRTKEHAAEQARIESFGNMAADFAVGAGPSPYRPGLNAPANVRRAIDNRLAQIRKDARDESDHLKREAARYLLRKSGQSINEGEIA